jgi:hypothetical protein
VGSRPKLCGSEPEFVGLGLLSLVGLGHESMGLGPSLWVLGLKPCGSRLESVGLGPGVGVCGI